MMNLPGGAARAAILASTVVKDSPRPHTHQRICFISVAAGGTDERRFRATARVAFGSGESRAALPDNPWTGSRDASRRLFITVSGSSQDLRRLLSTSRRGFRGHFASFAWRTTGARAVVGEFTFCHTGLHGPGTAENVVVKRLSHFRVAGSDSNHREGSS